MSRKSYVKTGIGPGGDEETPAPASLLSPPIPCCVRLRLPGVSRPPGSCGYATFPSGVICESIVKPADPSVPRFDAPAKLVESAFWTSAELNWTLRWYEPNPEPPEDVPATGS